MPVRVKHSRTPHLPWTGSATSDDRLLAEADVSRLFAGHPVTMSEKMDGECTTIYADGYCHARSLDSGPHESRTWVRRLAGEIAHRIPAGWRLCGENLYARHSIPYDALPSYFLCFSIYDERDVCLAWSDTRDFAADIGVETVPSTKAPSTRRGSARCGTGSRAAGPPEARVTWCVWRIPSTSIASASRSPSTCAPVT